MTEPGSVVAGRQVFWSSTHTAFDFIENGKQNIQLNITAHFHRGASYSHAFKALHLGARLIDEHDRSYFPSED